MVLSQRQGLYVAPKVQGVYHITATSTANPQKRAVATVTVLAYCDLPGALARPLVAATGLPLRRNASLTHTKVQKRQCARPNYSSSAPATGTVARRRRTSSETRKSTKQDPPARALSPSEGSRKNSSTEQTRYSSCPSLTTGISRFSRRISISKAKRSMTSTSPTATGEDLRSS